ncbi:MAG: nitrite reductase small subunit NirD [Methylococcaceae bacterium]
MAKWLDICGVDDLQPDSGICALIEGEQVAIFSFALRLRSGNAVDCSVSEVDRSVIEVNRSLSGVEGGDTQVYAVGNYDPIGKANVLSRGLICDINGQSVVASPLYKQHFNLQTGVCLEDEAVKIPVYPIRIENNRVQVSVGAAL